MEKIAEERKRKKLSLRWHVYFKRRDSRGNVEKVKPSPGTDEGFLLFKTSRGMERVGLRWERKKINENSSRNRVSFK